jgi:hypothetical protein
MHNIYLVVNQQQKNNLGNLSHTQLTIAHNYDNDNFTKATIIIDATDAWEKQINEINSKKYLWLIHAPYQLNSQIPYPIHRLNVWPTFFENTHWEATGNINEEITELIFNIIGKKIIASADVLGLIAGNTVAQIINEAYHTLSQKISSKADIDTAMKLGTGYPYGPFEWAEKIGIANIKQLLTAKATLNPNYTINSLLL